MFDTYVTIVGNVLTAPEWRRTTQSGTLVANFKVASTARRLDRDSGRWVDGNSLRVRVNCWRRLAEGVAASVAVGDPVIVAGRLYTRDWTDEAGTHRTLYELEAVAVGHDLSRGRARFLRNQPRAATSTVEDAEAEQRVHGEATEPVPDAQAPATFDGRPFDDDFPPPEYGGGRVGPVGTVERVGEPDPFDTRPGEPVSGRDARFGGPPGGLPGNPSGVRADGPSGAGAGLPAEDDELSPEEGDEPVPVGDDELGEVTAPVVGGPDEGDPGGASPGGTAGTASGRRGRRRTPVPA
ncbi:MULTISPECIES: single-stranded DNA-binding protein [unclassified Micromonospora]|uniref:single-stranded DNA-binding protein n=1 Tax=unclassified Micromonospora TaxID=2617518 RepID=UPI001C237B86|nr:MULTISPECIES: single-stranded DNA-binding protein [unclassified Micromonospora]MBU8856652.1 single-stranded DNA-binding protein [Micromonospora sp. WMMB482]MDM4782266.1 single-stranded DNA-binding protein [Micromonospora sp. b486]